MRSRYLTTTWPRFSARFANTSLMIGLVLGLPTVAAAQTTGDTASVATQTYTGECEGEVRPDRMVIVGGMSAQSLKPATAKTQLDRQIEAVRQYVISKDGKLILLETLRAVQPAARPSSTDNTAAQPFTLMQGLEAEFPLSDAIDTILERLLQLGLDRYGKQIRIDAHSSGPSVMVYYRFSDLRSRLEQLHAACGQRLAAQWCQAVPDRMTTEACKTNDRLDRWFPILAASFQSQPLLREYGNHSPLFLSYPWQTSQLRQVDLMGNTPLSLSGPLTIRTPAVKP